MDTLVTLQKTFPEYLIENFCDKIFSVRKKNVLEPKNNKFISWIDTRNYKLNNTNDILLLKKKIEINIESLSSNLPKILVVLFSKDIELLDSLTRYINDKVKIVVISKDNLIIDTIIKYNIEIEEDEGNEYIQIYNMLKKHTSILINITFFSNMIIYPGFFNAIWNTLAINDVLYHSYYDIISDDKKYYSGHIHNSPKIICTTTKYFQKYGFETKRKYNGIKYYCSNNKLLLFDENIIELLKLSFIIKECTHIDMNYYFPRQSDFSLNFKKNDKPFMLNIDQPQPISTKEISSTINNELISVSTMDQPDPFVEKNIVVSKYKPVDSKMAKLLYLSGRYL